MKMIMSKIKPIPKYILKRIEKADESFPKSNPGQTRFYAYLTKNDGELAKVTVAVKIRAGKRYCKQVAVHGVHSNLCFIKDMVFYRLGGYKVGWYEEGLQKKPKWYESDEWDLSYDNLFDPYAPIINREYLVKFPEYKYSAYNLYHEVEIFKYLRTYEKYPQVEYLMKAGLSSLKYSKQILQKIAVDKRFCKWLLANKEEIAKQYNYISVILRAYRTGKSLQQLQKFEEWKLKLIHDSSFDRLREEFKKDLDQLFNYLDQKDVSLYLYKDYYRACQFLNLDMTEEKHRYPHDFQRWHDIRIDEYATAKAMKDREERKELYDQFATIAEKYEGLQETKDGFAIVIAQSPADLIREGEALHHCVGHLGYDRKFIREETLIFFIRNSTDPDTPFVTMEYSLKTKKILQCYANYNAEPDESVLNFVRKKWLPYANRKVRNMQKTA